jgi:hypothetical protein
MWIFEVNFSEILALPKVDFVLLETNIYIVVYTDAQFDKTNGHMKSVYFEAHVEIKAARFFPVDFMRQS